VGPLVAFSAASGKQDHYILPIFPAVAVYSGLAMGHLFGSRSPDRLRAGRWTLAAHAVAFAAAGPGLVLYFRRDMPAYLAPFGVLALILLAGAALAGVLAWRGRLRTAMAALLATAAAAFLWSGPNLVAPMDRSTYDARFACKVRDLVGAGADIFSLQGANGTLVYYCEHPIRIVNSDSDIRARMAKGRPFYLILMDQDAKDTPIPGDLREIYREPNGREPERTRALLAWPGPPK
jgi:4-amino-4-deoxy-L-arabinose transferase-like glycosyltransferase